MPKSAAHALIWSPEHHTYTVYEQGQQQFSSLSEEHETWSAWLANRSSFSFQGKYGHLTLLKERRTRGNEGYWYAYRRQGKRRIKQYVGRTLNLTIARLEELAHVPDVQANKTHSADQFLPPAQQEHSAAEASQQTSQACARQELSQQRSEERRVGKECRSRWSPYH